ncbi:MAG: zinc ribbon domain-containing protein [Myxococcales bacterium]|nr:zinc ribbon domain-containing protein [Myxococcales bacterium]
MPIYEYRCQKCGHELEVMQKVSDPAPEPCPKCGAAQALERLMSRSSFQLKGGGWYSDLYSSAKKDSTSKTDGGSASGSSATTPGTGASSGSSSTSTPAGSGSSSGGSSSGGSGSGSAGGSSSGGSSSSS